MEETNRLQRFGEEVRVVVDSGNKWNNNTTFFYKLAQEIMPPIYVLGSRVIFWVVRRVYRGFVVESKLYWFVIGSVVPLKPSSA